MKRHLAIAAPACVAACLIAVSSSAYAQNRLESDATWRRHDRDGGPGRAQLTTFTFEVRFGGYYPKVDEESALGGKTPYFDYFGNGPQFYFGLELDWTPIRIPYLGKLGPALGWGITTMNAKAKVVVSDGASGSTSLNSDTGTSLTIHAMNVSAVLRIDEISRRTVLPIVPYAKAGLGLGLWSAGTDTGTSKIGSDCTQKAPKDCKVGEGLSIGPHIALGGMLGLNWLDPRSGAMGRQSLGVTQAYLFGEWMLDHLSEAPGKQAMNVGTSSWVLGLALDL